MAKHSEIAPEKTRERTPKKWRQADRPGLAGTPELVAVSGDGDGTSGPAKVNDLRVAFRWFAALGHRGFGQNAFRGPRHLR